MTCEQLTNPLIAEPGMSDPHALVIDDVCYLFTGHDVGFGIGDWVMPDWRIYRSDDLREWQHVGTISPKDNYMGENRDQWYHVWCRYRDRSYDRIRDCFIAPVIYDPDGSMHDNLEQLGAQ